MVLLANGVLALAWLIAVDGELPAASSAAVFRFEGIARLAALLPLTLGVLLLWIETRRLVRWIRHRLLGRARRES
ncbi:MAG: hypothetical protein ABR561_00530 [Guyparkeria sp.]